MSDHHVGPDLALELGLRMCEAWGLNPSDVLGITIAWQPQNLPTAHVELLLSERAAMELLTLSVVHREHVDLGETVPLDTIAELTDP